MSESESSGRSTWQMPLLFIVIVSLVITGGYASYIFLSTSQALTGEELQAVDGASVSVDYIGMFEDGTVFDTSIRTVAENNTLYPKSLSFTSRYEYSPLNFTVGSGSMINGFEDGVVGMTVGQTKVIVVPPELGYGQPDASLIVTRNITETVPVYEWFGNTSQFLDVFMVQPLSGSTVKSLDYGWNMTVEYVDAQTGMVLLKNTPYIGEVVTPEGMWSTKVVSIDTTQNMGMGEITIKHLVSPTSIGAVLYEDESGQQFVVSEVDEASGTFTLDYNREVVGRTLVFKVTVVSITPPA